MAEEKTNAAEENRSTAKATGIIGIAVMLSRILGLARDMLMNHLFSGILASCFALAFKIPNLLRDLFAEGALSQAFVTTFSKKLQEEGDKSAWVLANRVLSLAAVSMSVITLIGVIVAPWIVDIILSLAHKSYGENERQLIILMTRIMYPFILIISLSALVMGMLNAKKVFGMPALASCFFNLGSIIGGGLIGYWLDPSWGEKSLIGVSIGVLIGGIAQLVVQFPSLWKIGFRPRWDSMWKDGGVKKILALMLPAIIAASAVQVNVMVNAMFAASTGAESVAALGFAFRLVQLPLGMFGVAVATITLPALARAAVGSIGSEFAPTLTRGINMVTVLVIPSGVGLGLLALPVVRLIFSNYPELIASTLQCYAYGLLFYSWLKIVQPAFYAMDKRWIPMMVSFLSVALNFFLNWYFVRVLGLGVESLALTTSLIALINFALLYLFLKKLVPSIKTALILDTLWRCAIAALVMGSLCYLANKYLLHDLSSMMLILRWLIVGAVIGAVAVVYFGLCYVLGVREARDCIGMVLRRIPGLKKFAPRR
jgi:putative peptidoglycan lipid II flippase